MVRVVVDVEIAPPSSVPTLRVPRITSVLSSTVFFDRTKFRADAAGAFSAETFRTVVRDRDRLAGKPVAGGANAVSWSSARSLSRIVRVATLGVAQGLTDRVEESQPQRAVHRLVRVVRDRHGEGLGRLAAREGLGRTDGRVVRGGDR